MCTSTAASPKDSFTKASALKLSGRRRSHTGRPTASTTAPQISFGAISRRLSPSISACTSYVLIILIRKFCFRTKKTRVFPTVYSSVALTKRPLHVPKESIWPRIKINFINYSAN